MRNFKITVQYDGTDYHGWQIQATGRTIQGELTRILSLIDHRHVTVHGAGRTDAGVHAEGQVASFRMETDFKPAKLCDAINGNLSRDIRVIDAEIVPASFNARFSAKLKTYRYRVWTAPSLTPFNYRYVYHSRGALDTGGMERAARDLVGAHDFSAFTVGSAEVEDRVRTIEALKISREGDEVAITAEGRGFLRYMVRTIAGTLIEVGRGKRAAESVAQTLHSRRRDMAGATAPACGLTLVRVDY